MRVVMEETVRGPSARPRRSGRCAPVLPGLAFVALVACSSPTSPPTGRPVPPRPVVASSQTTTITRHDASARVRDVHAPRLRPPAGSRGDRTPPAAADPVGTPAGGGLNARAGRSGGALEPAPERSAPASQARPPARDPADEYVLAPEEAKRLAGGYLRRLRSDDVDDAKDAFRELWEVPREAVPFLLAEVENRTRTRLLELRIAVFQPVGQVGEGTGDAAAQLAYYIPGMAGVKFDDISAGIARSRRFYDVRLKRKKRGFPLGAVVRAALLNRFRSPDYPPGNDRHDARGWWQEYYLRVRSRL